MALLTRPIGGVTKSQGKGLSRRGGACFGRARDPNGIEICQVRIRDELCTLHPKPCNHDSESSPDTRDEARRTEGGAEQKRDFSAKGRDHDSGAGLGKGGQVRVFVLENQTAPRGGAAPPVPVWERGGPLDPREALRILNIWDPQNKVMGSRGGFWKEESHLRAKGRNVRLWRDLARDGRLGLGKSNGNVRVQDNQDPRNEQGKGSGITGLGSKGQEGLKVLPVPWDGDLY